MRKLTFILTFVLFYSFCYSQEDSITLNFNISKKKFDEKTESKEFKYGTTYKIKINGINTAVYGYKFKSKSYSLVSSVPEIIKPIFPVMTETPVITAGIKTDQMSFIDNLCSESENKYLKLHLIKKEADVLYGLTKTDTDSSKAESVRIKVFTEFNVKSFDELKRKVNLFSKYIILAQEVIKKRMDVDSNYTSIEKYNELMDKYNKLSCIVDIVKSNDYIFHVTFIENSSKAESCIEYMPLKAEKDIVDLTLTLIDNYAKDTIYNSSISFYTSKNFTFAFSTGFFYNNLREESYYLDVRKEDTLKINVKPEEYSNYDFSIGALGHLSYKLCNWFKPGISIGAAFSPLDGKTRYLIGGSILFFRKNQLEINGGAAFARMKVLSGSVQTDDNGQYVPAGTPSVPTFEEVRTGFYVGLTYNLTSVKK